MDLHNDMEEILIEAELDDEIKEYLLHGVLAGDSESFDDVNELQETLQEFIEDENVLQRLMGAIKRFVDEFGASSSTTDDGTLQAASKNSMRLLETPQTLSSQAINESNNGESDVLTTMASTTSTSETHLPVSNATRPRKERRHQKQQQNDQKHNDTKVGEDDELAVEQNWGGRGKGGRGEYSAAVNSVKSNIHLSNVSILLDNGLDLLSGSPMDIVKGHKYGLIGRNGVGKSTLLRRLAHKAIPGIPHDMRIRLVQQHLVGTDDSALEALIKSDTDRTALLEEHLKVEARLEMEDLDDEEVLHLAERLEAIVTEMDVSDADSIETRALEILHGLQFTHEMIHAPTRNLSGGWRMRLSLAQSILTTSDLILFDECTNHLDLHGLDWLISYLSSDSERTLIIVSHDTTFLDAVCTDIVVLEHKRLTYHYRSNYSDYLRQVQEKAARESQILDAAERQRASAQAFIQKQQSISHKKSADPNKQRQARMMKEKKLERIGNYREDGKRYKNFSLATLSEDSIRLAQNVQVEIDEPIITMRFPNPAWPAGLGDYEPLVRLEGFSFGYHSNLLLHDLTVSVDRRTKAAIVGINGAGKSSLMKLISGDIIPADYQSTGSIWSRPDIRVGHVTQYAVEELEQYDNLSVVAYAEEQFRSSRVAVEMAKKASGNIRQYLGAFGLGGRHALQKIKHLSGGERMRLAFATGLADEPHLLCLDESTNHVDLETLNSMSKALNAFDGAVLMISHNQGFLAGFCNELWVLDKGQLALKHSTESSFDDLFSEYRASALQSGRVLANRQQKGDLAKRASKQTVGRKYRVLM
ncbi:hypothetical protein MPSEU_000686500 [Mayamaea pseudoterrestris]|nr:hypothetical protein MPSEU_000686500 [Mayamaea pseudoterrestris]